MSKKLSNNNKIKKEDDKRKNIEYWLDQYQDRMVKDLHFLHYPWVILTQKKAC